MIYIDNPFAVPKDHPTAPRCFRGKLSAHLMADSEAELVAYAVSIGMREDWIQKRGTAYVHFDVTGSRLNRVLSDARVRRLTPREMAVMIRERQTVTTGANNA
jgi:hypothetical protein